MTNQQAKFILSAYRPGSEDAADPKFAEALEQARRDPELAEWFARERSFDAAVANAFSSIPIPSDLRENILAGGKVSRRSVWSKRRVFALAALIAIAAVIAGIWFNRASQLDVWQKDALTAIPMLHAGQMKLDHRDNDGRALQQWLQAQHAPAPDPLPPTLQALRAVGCKTIMSGGKPVSIICFRLPGNKMLHVVVTDAAGLGHPPPERPRFVREDGWITASWTENGRACMLATKGSESELRQLLPNTAAALKNSCHRPDTQV